MDELNGRRRLTSRLRPDSGVVGGAGVAKRPRPGKPPVAPSLAAGGASSSRGGRARAEGPAPARPAALRFQLLDECRQHLVQVAHDAVVGHLEDRGVLVFVHGHDELGRADADRVLDLTGDAYRHIEVR